MEEMEEQGNNNIIIPPTNVVINAADITKIFKSIKDTWPFHREMSKINIITYRSIFSAGAWVRHDLLFAISSG